MKIFKKFKNWPTVWVVILAFGVALAGFFIGNGVYRSLARRTVTVKGLAEMDVVADTAVWNIKFNRVGGDLTSVQAAVDEDIEKTRNFLLDNGFEENELQNKVKVLQDKITKLTNEEIPTVSTEKEKVSMDLPFSSPFIEATSTKPEKKSEDAVQSILEAVKEEVKEEPKEEKTDMPTFSELMEAESKEDRLSIVVNRYNTDIEAITKGKGAKFISLSETEQTKLQTGKIN